MPASNVEYWKAKFERNIRRDKRIARELKKLGWRCVEVWECETKEPRKLDSILRRKVLARKPAAA
jgi:DNA mismatch endonuclease (patch repair protein)